MNLLNNKDRFLRLKEVQDLLGVSRSTVWRWQAERGLKVVRIGDVVRVREGDLQEFLKRHDVTDGQRVADGMAVEAYKTPKNTLLTPQTACGK